MRKRSCQGQRWGIFNRSLHPCGQARLCTLYHSCSSWSENSVFSRRSCSISGRSLLFCFPMSAGRDSLISSATAVALARLPGPPFTPARRGQKKDKAVSNNESRATATSCDRRAEKRSGVSERPQQDGKYGLSVGFDTDTDVGRRLKEMFVASYAKGKKQTVT